jgi:hypothetical protein
MKTVKIIFFVSILLITGIAKSVASENKAYSRAITQLQYEVETSFKQFPFEAIHGENNECVVVVTFIVDQNHEMKNIHVESEDESLANYVQKILERKNLELDAALDGKMCRMPIRFVNAR